MASPVPKKDDELDCKGRFITGGLVPKGALRVKSVPRWFNLRGFHVQWANIKNPMYPIDGFDMRNVTKLESASNGLKFTVGPDPMKPKLITISWEDGMVPMERNRWRAMFCSAVAAVALDKGRRTQDAEGSCNQETAKNRRRLGSLRGGICLAIRAQPTVLQGVTGPSGTSFFQEGPCCRVPCFVQEPRPSIPGGTRRLPRSSTTGTTTSTRWPILTNCIHR